MKNIEGQTSGKNCFENALIVIHDLMSELSNNKKLPLSLSQEATIGT